MHDEFNLVKAPGRGATAVGTGIFTWVRRVSIVGVPSSAASYAAGQDLAPAALRSAGLPGQLAGSGLEVHDDGDLPHQVWRPDRDHPLAQNAGQATASLRQLADRLGLRVTTSQALAADPAGAARAALDQLPPGPLAVHLDVDALDFIDAPLAENTDCRNTGPTLGQAVEALQLAARDPRIRA